MSDTTPIPTTGDQTNANADQDNEWSKRYQGLQRVLAQRDEALAASTADLDRLRQEHEQATAELTAFRDKEASANEEENARQQYEALRERFEPKPPAKPLGNNPVREWFEPERQQREREPIGSGLHFPT